MTFTSSTFRKDTVHYKNYKLTLPNLQHQFSMNYFAFCFVQNSCEFSVKAMREQFNPFLTLISFWTTFQLCIYSMKKIRKSKKIFTVCLFLSKCIITPIGLFFQNSIVLRTDL